MSPLQEPGIAIVGIAAELPSGSWSEKNLDYESFFQFLLEKGQAYEKIPSDRFNTEYILGHGVGKVSTDSGAFLKNLELFDYLEFGVSPKDAHLMPLGGRKLLETSFLALLDSGIDYRGHNVGCYMSGISHDTLTVSGQDDHEASKGSFVAGPSMIANRVSYHLDLRGPSIPIDTACSSSLVATHMAVQALLHGECEAAVVGGCQVNQRFGEWLTYTGGGILAPDGRCKPFDEDADGFSRGEGVVSIVLKPLSAALRDNDKIYGTILGTGMNSAGSQAPVAAPVAAAQMDAMLRAFAQAGRRPQDVDFVELHATGTAAGDPTEANWVGAQFTRADELLVGSVKGNIGHLEITAFLASLCKICAMIEMGRIPPTVNLKTPNHRIGWEKYNMRAPVEEERLSRRAENGRPLIAMASSGIGGVNAHCVLEGPPRREHPSSPFWLPETEAPVLLVAGGLSPHSATAVCDSLAALESRDSLASISRVHGRRARSMPWRAFAVASSASQSPISFSKPVLTPRDAPAVAFVYSGQGPQHWQMGRELFATCKVFRHSIIELDAVYKSIVGSSLIETTGLFENTAKDAEALGSVWPIEVTLPSLTILQLALTDTLAAVGIKPDAIIGHSAGETAVLAASGAGSKALAIELAITRARAMALLEEKGGAMAAVSCSPDRAKQLIVDVLAELGNATATLEIGCHNTPEAVTLSGTGDAIDLAVKRANKSDIFARRLQTRVPVHSSMMEMCRDAYVQGVNATFSHHTLSRPAVQTFSTKTGSLLEGEMDAQYFWDGTRGPVLFTEAMQDLLAHQPNVTLIEIGPHPALTGYLSAIAGDASTVLTTLRRPRRTETSAVELRTFMDCLGGFITAGHNSVNFDVICKASASSEPRIPAFPLAPRHVPIYNNTFERTRVSQPRLGPLNYSQIQINAQTHPELAGHVIKEEPIMPGAGYVEMALEFGAKRLRDVKYLSVLTLSSEKPAPVNFRRDGSFWTVESADPDTFANSWPPKYDRVHASGYALMDWGPENDLPSMDIEHLRNSLPIKDIKDLYEGFGSLAQYGSTYQRVLSVRMGRDAQGRDEMLIKLRGADDDLPELSQYRLHPAILDAAGHILVHPIASGLLLNDNSGYYLPSGIREVVIHRELYEPGFPSVLYSHIVVTNWTTDALTADLTILTPAGTRLVTLLGLEIALHSQSTVKPERRYDIIWRQLDVSVTSPSKLKTEFSYPNGSGNGHAIHASHTNGFANGHAIDVSHTNGPTNGHAIHASNTNGSAKHLPSPQSLAPAAAVAHKQPPVWEHTELGILVNYERGQETRIQDLVKTLDPLREETIWFLARAGIDGAAALGFRRSFRKEYDLWTVGVAAFDPAWDDVRLRRTAALELLKLSSDDLEVHVDASGSLHVPRIVELTSTSPADAFQPRLPWKISSKQVQYIPLPTVPDDHILVRVDYISAHSDHIWFFTGHLEGTAGRFGGIAQGNFTNVAVVPRESLLILSSKNDAEQPRCLLAPTIVFLAVGPGILSNAARRRGLSVVVTHCESELGKQIASCCSRLGLDVRRVPGPVTVDDVAKDASERFIMISGSEAEHESRHLAQLVGDCGKAFLWNRDLVRLMNVDPGACRDALLWASESYSEGLDVMYPVSQIASAHDTTGLGSPEQLFDPLKGYLLVGGVGSIGSRIALWMYQNGARDITLTSRTGGATVQARADFMPRRILSYLQSLPDLVLRIEAANAESVVDMHRVVNGIQSRKPLAGVMLLAGAIMDRSFVSQTQERFDKVINPKIRSFQAIEAVTSIPDLDFLIGCSSIAAVFGTTGQTNYASANAALAGLTSRYRNAFSIIIPAITDSNFFLDAAAASKMEQYQSITDWGMTARDFCECIGDALRQAQQSQLHEYIPDIDWEHISQRLGVSTLYNHLIPQRASDNSVSEVKDSKLVLREIICKVLYLRDGDLSPDVPLSSYGLDSSSATALSYALRPLFAISQIQLIAGQTLAKLEKRLESPDSLSAEGETSANTVHADTETHKTRLMLDLVKKYTTSLPPIEHQGSGQYASGEKVILITGTTGSLGTHVLADLLPDTAVAKIYALVRPHEDISDITARQRDAFLERNLDASLLGSDKLVVLGGDVSKENFGLDRDTFTTIASQLTHIFHIGWPTEFTLPLTQYEPAIKGVRNMCDCAALNLRRSPAKIVFVSANGVSHNWSSPKPVPEEAILDPNVAATSSGYTESKWVAERVLGIAAEKGYRVTIVRVTQLTAAANGLWNTKEWFPALVAASTALGCLPEAPGTVSWLPVATAARALSEMLDSDKLVLHLVNPKAQPVSSLLAILASALHLQRVSYGEWLQRLRVAYTEGTDDAKKPYLRHAMSLMDVFEYASRVKTGVENFGFTRRQEFVQALGASHTLQRVASENLTIEASEVDGWVAWWRRVGFLPPQPY